jgi:hypothetical protein
MTTSSNVSLSSAKLSSARQDDKAVRDVSSVRAENQKIAFGACEDNILKSYSNVTYRWTLAPLTPKQVTQLQTGIGIGSLNPGLANIVICSGGGRDADRASTIYGSPEYFIDNVEINTLATPTRESGLSGNLTMNFDVIEPYSLGLFIQSLQAAALRSTYTNYLECTWLMQVDFFGVDVNGKQKTIPDATRLYTQKLQQISFVATEAGSKYQVKTLDFNLEAFNNVYGTFPSAANFQGSTVEEALSSLAKVLNAAQELAVKQKIITIADEYEIVVKAPLIPNVGYNEDKMRVSRFPVATSSDNSSGPAKAPAKSADGRGAPEYAIRKFTYPPDDKRRIVDMIREVMISSEFITAAIKPENIDPDDGMINWYRISVVTEYKGTNGQQAKVKTDPVQNRPAYKFTFVVAPYRVHHSVAKVPLGPTLGMSDKGLKSTIKKQYNYLYTGLNDDIIRWELKFDNTFYTSIPFSSTVTEEDVRGYLAERPANGNAAPANQGSNLITHAGRLMRDKPGSYVKPMGGSTVDSADIRTARAFEQAIMLGTEMITLNMTILGDPYYLSKSGAFLEQIGAIAPGSQINNDKTMAAESGEVRVFLRFRTPIDAPTPGRALFIFPASGYSDSPFSGLYKIRSVKSKFHEGVFTQELDLFRDRGQQPEEISSLRSDPSAIFNSAIVVDQRINGYNGTPAAAAAPPAAPATVNSDTPEKSSVVPSATVITTPVPDPAAGIEVTNRGVVNSTNLPAAPAPFNKTGPNGEKLPYTQELENKLNTDQ